MKISVANSDVFLCAILEIRLSEHNCKQIKERYEFIAVRLNEFAV